MLSADDARKGESIFEPESKADYVDDRLWLQLPNVEYADDWLCPKCKWDADGADIEYLIACINSEPVTAPGYPMKAMNWEELWKCPVCRTFFIVENCNY